MGILSILFSLIFTVLSPAIDLDFRFVDGYCQKRKVPGTNPEFFGECGNLTKSRFINQNYEKINLKGGVFNSSYFYVTTIKGGDLSHAAFRRSIILQTEFKDVVATHLDLRGSHFKGVRITDSNLKNVFATGTRFIKTDFSNTDLSNGNFWGSQLQSVNFSNADLRGTNLSRTFILFSNFEGAQFDDKTQLPFSEEVALEKGMVKVD